jgi:hypothetical protein
VTFTQMRRYIDRGEPARSRTVNERCREPDAERENPLGAAEGILYAALLATPFWIVVYFVVRWLQR